MSCIQITGFNLTSSSCTFLRRKALQANGASQTAVFLGRKVPNISLKLTTESRYWQCGPVCLFGGKGKPGNGSEASPWKAIEKATGFLKKKTSIEDVLKQQIEKKEFYDGGSGGEGGPPGGGGGGDGFGGFGGASDESPSEMLEEFGHKMLAIFALLFLYAYILNGETITVLAKDILKFIFRGQQSIRLRRLIKKWKNFLDSMKQKEEYYDPLWLEHAIINTPTMYDSPAKYKKILKTLSPTDDSSPPKKVDSSPPKKVDSSPWEYDDSSPPEYVDAGYPEYDDSSPPGYFDVGPPDDDDDDQYTW